MGCHPFIDENQCSRHRHAPTEPDPHAWLTKERLGKLSDLTLSARPLLLQAGLWRATLGYWVREQASLEAYWDPQDEKQALDKLEEQWRAKTTTDGLNLDPEYFAPSYVWASIC